METVKEENEKKKEYLKQYGKALRQEKRIEEELERLKLDRMLPGALAADGLPKSSNLSDLSDYAAEVDEQERKMVEQRKKRVRIRTEIRERIEQMEDETEKDILTYHYIDLMGATGVRVTEYDQTKAMENADLIIANCFANGRAVDDNVAVIFDVTKLEEY